MVILYNQMTVANGSSLPVVAVVFIMNISGRIGLPLFFVSNETFTFPLPDFYECFSFRKV